MKTSVCMTLPILAAALVNATPNHHKIAMRAPTAQTINSADATCQKIFATCVNELSNQGGASAVPTKFFGIRACVLASTCASDAANTVSSVVSAAVSSLGGQNAPSTTTFSRVQKTSNEISRQNFVDLYYSVLSDVGGPWPSDVSVVTGYFDRVQAWTGFCGKSVPYNNWADFFSYQSVAAAPLSCSTGGTTPPPSSSNPIVISPVASCQKMLETCVSAVRGKDVPATFFNTRSCVLAATCYDLDPEHTVAGTYKAVLDTVSPNAAAVTISSLPRVSSGVINALSTDGGKTVTQQNWIDAWYSALSEVGGPYPSGVDVVLEYWDQVTAWSGFCGRAVPASNFADFFTWSDTVEAPFTCSTDGDQCVY